MTFKDLAGKKLLVPAYQRAFAWEAKQVDPFVADLERCRTKKMAYYYGHFILEEEKGHFEIVDGQQRLTLAALFFAVCKQLGAEQVPELDFQTVDYDREAFAQIIGADLPKILQVGADKYIEEHCKLYETLSSLRLIRTLHNLGQQLKDKDLSALITILQESAVSWHEAKDKSVAVQIFELHNTRGIRLGTIEIVKAKLMQHVYENAPEAKDAEVAKIQDWFAKIYELEEQVKGQNFRGNLGLAHLLRLHLQVVDNGLAKHTVEAMQNRDVGGNDADNIAYIVGRLDKDSPGINYALDLAKEFLDSVKIVCQTLRQWDKECDLVGDVLLLHRDRSIKFFLVLCRRVRESIVKDNLALWESKEIILQLTQSISREDLALWERLLYTLDFHERYKGVPQNKRARFHGLFSEIASGKELTKCLTYYVAHSFHGRASNLQAVVFSYLKGYQGHILHYAYDFWSHKMQYLLYKYEKSLGCDVERLRSMYKQDVSLEHILAGACEAWETLRGDKSSKELLEEVDNYSNGLGNLLLLAGKTNTSLGNKNPAEKVYPKIGGSYTQHQELKTRWQDPSQWPLLIKERGEKILAFLFSEWLFAQHEQVYQKAEQVRQLLADFEPWPLNTGSTWWNYYHFDLDRPKSNSKERIRIFVHLPKVEFGINPLAVPAVQAEFFLGNITGSTKEELHEAIWQETIGGLMGKNDVNADDFAGKTSKYYALSEMADFAAKLRQVIASLQEQGYQPLPTVV